MTTASGVNASTTFDARRTHDGPSSRGVAAPLALPSCGCPQGPGRRISDPVAHAAWHALVVEQGGPAGVVDAASLRDARGFKTETLHADTILDVRNRETGRSVNGARRRAAQGEPAKKPTI